MSATTTAVRGHKDVLQRLRARVDALALLLRARRTQGWDPGGLEQAAAEADRLFSAAGRIDASWANAVAPLRAPMQAARQAQQLPDPAATARMLAIAEQLLLQLSSTAAPTGGDVATPARVRAETPPPKYWRRWATDAPAPQLPATFASGSNSDPAPASPSAPASDPAMMMPADTLEPAAAPTASADTGEAPYRVLIVEDDRTQALFAEGVLNGAGIEALVAAEPHDVLATMVRVQPDLVLMDLHMPGLSGTELTALIRRHDAFMHTPIVFLTGDPDPEKQFEVLECGADDFLQKPIRPRHLIAAVESRVRRARTLGQARTVEASRHPVTGLSTRSHLLQHLGASLPGSQRGGLLFIEIEGTSSLREHYGYAALERLITEAGRLLGTLAGRDPATRLNDSAFLVYAADTEATQLEALARELRDGIGRHPFELDGDRLRLRATIGHVALQHGFSDAGSALEAAEKAVRLARSHPIGLAAYAPPEHDDLAHSRDLAHALVEALAQDRFELAYQPIVAVAGGEEAQYQTLLRLRDAAGAVRNAAEIVPAAEAAGQIHAIDQWVLEHALDVLQQRRAQGRPVRLFVPQSPRTLARDDYAAWLTEAFGARGLEGPSLVIDLRLADALIHSVTLRQFCEHLLPTGVQFCLSQYEHGPDADALLTQLPLGYLRLSARYADSQGGATLRDEMRVAIDRAHRLGLQVVGHRVEDPQAAATLWMSGIDYIQGNLVQQAAGELDFDFQHAVL